jgi:hypothetical protein
MENENEDPGPEFRLAHKLRAPAATEAARKLSREEPLLMSVMQFLAASCTLSSRVMCFSPGQDCPVARIGFVPARYTVAITPEDWRRIY